MAMTPTVKTSCKSTDMRNQTGVGATWAIVSSSVTILKLSLMLLGEATDYAAPAVLPDDSLQSSDRPLPRATPRLYCRQDLGRENTALVSEFCYQQVLQTPTDYRWTGKLASNGRWEKL